MKIVLSILFPALMALAIPTWASENLSDSWDLLEGQSAVGDAYVARSPVSMSFELETGINTAISIYVASPTPKYNYCSVSLNVAIGDKLASINRHKGLIARWRGKKDTTSIHSFLMPNKGVMIKNPYDFIENLKSYDEVELTYYLVGKAVVKNGISLKGSSKAIHKACSISTSKPRKPILSTSISRASVKKRIDAEMDKTIKTGSFCGSKLYYRLVDNSLYVGVKGISRNQEILQTANSAHWQIAKTALNTPPFDKKIRSGKPFYLDMLCD